MGGTSLRVMGAIRNRRAEKGAALVEMALVLTLLVMLLLGTVTAGLAYGRSNALQTAAREGTRFGATLPDSGTWLDSVLDVTKAAAIGDLAGTVSGQYICVALVSSSGTKRMTETGGVRSGVLASECFLDGRPSEEERVQVVVQRDATINAVVFTTTITLESESAARYER